MTNITIQLNEKMFNYKRDVVLCTNCGHQLEEFEIKTTECGQVLFSLVDDYKNVSINPVHCPKCKANFMNETKKCIDNLQILKAPSRQIK